MVENPQSFFRPQAPLSIIKALIQLGLAPHLESFKRATHGDLTGLARLSDRVLGMPTAGLHSLEELEKVATSAKRCIDLSVGYPKGVAFDSETLALSFEWAKNHGIALDGYPPYFGWPAALGTTMQDVQEATGQMFVPGEELIFTNGATQAFAMIAEAFLNPGDAVVLLEPSYLFFGYTLKLKQVHLRWVPTKMQDGEMLIDESALVQALKGAKCLILNSPANPTGAVLRREVLETILRCAAKAKVLVVSDEIYQDFCYGIPWTSAAAFPKYRQNVIICHSYSKALGMAAWRLGYLAGPAALIRPLKMVSVLLSPYAPSLSQALLGYLLPQKRQLLQPLVSRLLKVSQETFELLKNDFPTLQLAKAGMFHWLPVPKSFRSGVEFSEFLIKKAGVIVLAGEHFGPRSSNHVRISYAGELDEVMTGCHRLLEAVRMNASKAT